MISEPAAKGIPVHGILTMSEACDPQQTLEYGVWEHLGHVKLLLDLASGEQPEHVEFYFWVRVA